MDRGLERSNLEAAGTSNLSADLASLKNLAEQIDLLLDNAQQQGPCSLPEGNRKAELR